MEEHSLEKHIRKLFCSLMFIYECSIFPLLFKGPGCFTIVLVAKDGMIYVKQFLSTTDHNQLRFQ